MIFYKAKLYADEQGIEVQIDKWHVIRETPCFYFCCNDWTFQLLHPRDGETLEDAHKRFRPTGKLKRIAKGSDRFASPTEEEALKKLRWIKGKQLNHMRRETAFINKFLGCDNLNRLTDSTFLIPDSADLVSEYLVFN